MRKKLVVLLMFVLLAMILVGCMPGDGSYTKEDPANVFSGIWHGWIAPVSLVRGFFNRSIRLYEVNNSGYLYDLGFYAAILGGFGGITFSRKKKND